jgi:uncharacterized protein YciI
MPQYLILANDFTDDDAINRRLAVRQAHLDRMGVTKADGGFVIGGAKLDETGKMIGSMIVINAETEEAAREWAQNDPYITGNVWETVDIQPFRVANV